MEKEKINSSFAIEEKLINLEENNKWGMYVPLNHLYQ
jgi:hypothetical protein